VGFLSVVLPVCLAWAFADTELEVDSAELVTDDICSLQEVDSAELVTDDICALQVRAAKISAEMDPKIEDQEQSAQAMFKEQDQDSSSGLTMAEFTPSRPAVEQVQTNASASRRRRSRRRRSGGCNLNACSSGSGFGPPACNKKETGGKCPCPRKTTMHKAFVASWESSVKHQNEWNPVWGLLHMSVQNFHECRPASGCHLVITLGFGHETSEKCANYYPVSHVYFHDGSRTCFNTFKKCFEKKAPTAWHTVIAKGHSPKDRHWKWMP